MLALVDSRTAKALATLLLFALAFGFLYVAHHTLMAFLFAIFFAYLVDPLVSRVERWTHSRGRAIAAIYLLIVLLVIAFFFFIGPSLARQAQRLGEATPGLIDKITSGQIAEQIGAEHGWNLRTRQLLEQFLSSHRDDLIAMAQRVGLRVAEAAQQAWLLVVVPILAIFFLKDGPAFRQVLLTLVHSRAQRELLEGVFGDLNLMLAQFIRAQLTLAALSFVAYISFLSVMRAPYALVLSSAGGLMEFIPLVGPLVTAVVMLSVALLTSYTHWAVLLIFLLAWRMIQDYLVSPRVMGKSMELHPLAAIFGVLAGGEIAGVLGIYLSIPVMASLRIVWRRWRVYAEKRRFGPLNEYSFGPEISSGQSE